MLQVWASDGIIVVDGLNPLTPNASATQFKPRHRARSRVGGAETIQDCFRVSESGCEGVLTRRPCGPDL